MYARFVALSVAVSLGALVGATEDGGSRQQPYSLQDFYEGNDFFNEWSFFTGSDPTGGNVNYLDMQDAMDAGLAYVDQDNTVVLAVDSTSYVPPGGNRNAVRITSNKQYTGGLFILDALAMSVGCGTWPSFWTNGPNWPQGGEIDIVEGINNQQYNQMTLHSGTSNPCTIDLTASRGTYTGHVLGTQCLSSQSDDSGCSIMDSSASSFAYGFNDIGGGVFALLWDTSAGMKIWHFPRQNIPEDIIDRMPMPSNWGIPAGAWSAESCDIADNFYDHSMIFDTTICGGWAGNAYSSSGCPGTCADMVANATNFADALWRINYVAVYQ